MKTLLKIFVICHLPFAIGLSAFAQGSLTPPGPPAPTMKSADQIEPRTIVNAANTPGNSFNLFIISQPGSYYLTTNLVGVSAKNGISIGANNVTLDLNGFALLGVSGSQDGINLPGGPTNVTVRNGSVSGWGGYGVYNGSGCSVNVVFERLNVSGSGSYGIFYNDFGAACVVRDCNSQNNYSGGIVCGVGIVSGCTANNNGWTGIVGYAAAVSGCTANNNGMDGIDVYSGTVSGCLVSQNRYSGITLNLLNSLSGSEAVGNVCIGNNTANSASDAGICIYNGNNNRIENNHVTASGSAGIRVYNSGYTNNIIIKNSVSGNGANNYVLPGAQIVGPLIINTGAITNVNPWANFSY